MTITIFITGGSEWRAFKILHWRKMVEVLEVHQHHLGVGAAVGSAPLVQHQQQQD